MTTDRRRRTTIRLPVPTGPDRLHFAYSHMRWLYQATCEAMIDASSGTRRSIQRESQESVSVILPENIPMPGFRFETLVIDP